MAEFQCRIADKSGKITTIQRRGENRDLIARDLQKEGYFPLAIEQIKSDPNVKKGFKSKTILEFSEVLHVLLSSGLPLKEATDIAGTVFNKGQTYRLANQIAESLNKGKSFYNTISEYGTTFPPVYRGLVRVGEKVGTLETIFGRIVSYMQDGKKLKDKLISAMIYPLLILVFMFFGIFGLIVFLLPKLEEIFSVFGKDMADTMGSMNVFLIILLIFLGLILIGGNILALYLKFARSRNLPSAVMLDKFLFKIPLVGKILLNQETMNFVFAMEILTSSGITMEAALSESCHVLKNHAYIESIKIIREEIIKGRTFSSALKKQNILPDKIQRWAVVGERSGQVDTIFGQLKVFYQNEIEKFLSRILVLIEPAIMILVALILILMIIYFIIPIFSMYGDLL